MEGRRRMDDCRGRKSYYGFGLKLGLPPALTRLASARVARRMRNFIFLFCFGGWFNRKIWTVRTLETGKEVFERGG
jgi:hypothetical protein